MEINECELLNNISRLINISNLHQKTFSEFKNKFYGKKVVLVGAGPTLNYFEPIGDAIYIGVNRTFLKKDIKFDYLFTIDRAGLETIDCDYYEEFFRYREDSCIKFVGDQNLGIDFQIPESKIIGKNIRRYKTTANLLPYKYTLDIESEPLGNFASTGLQAVQFALYGNPKEIYLVGFDCNVIQAGHFVGGKSVASLRGGELEKANELSIQNWKELRQFRNLYYPDTKLISINPVVLRGVYDEDIFTESYKRSENKIKYEEPLNKPLSEKYDKILAEINFDKYFEELCNELKDKNIILYGIGELFSYLYYKYDFSKLNIIGISDKKFGKYEKYFYGYRIISPEKIENYNPDKVLVAVLRDDEMIKILKKDMNVEIGSLLRPDKDLPNSGNN